MAEAFTERGHVVSTQSGYQPQEEEVHVYVQSDYQDGPGALPGGNDDNDGSLASPQRTFDGVRRRIARRAIEGCRIVVHAMGYGGTDPVDAPAERRTYRTREIYLGGGEVARNSWCIRGPRSMWQIVAGLGFDHAEQVGLRVKVIFTTSELVVAAHRARHLRIRRSDGREYCFPHPISDSGANYVMLDSTLTAADFNADLGASDTLDLVDPAVTIEPDGHMFNGVLINGFGAFKAGDRLAPPDYNYGDINPASTIERVRIVRGRCVAPGVFFDTCALVNSFQARGGWVRFGMCSANAGLKLQCGSRSLGEATAFANTERLGRSLTSTDPAVSTQGMDLQVCGPFFIGDFQRGDAGGQFRVFRAFSIRHVYHPDDAAINVIGSDSTLFMSNEARLFAQHDLPVGQGIWCKDGATARLVATGVELAVQNGDLRLDGGPAISMADFIDATKWNGNFHRAHQVNAGGYPTGGLSHIWDKRIE